MAITLLPILAQASSNSGAAGIALGGVFVVIFILLAIAASIFWLWMLVDCLTSSLPSTEKLIWVLLIVFLHVLGALLYFLIARGNRSTA